MRSRAVPLCDKASCTRVKAQYIVYELPHIRIEQPLGLAEYSTQIVPRPFEFTRVAGNTKSHLRTVDSDVLGVELEKAQKVGVGARIEYDLCTWGQIDFYY